VLSSSSKVISPSSCKRQKKDKESLSPLTSDEEHEYNKPKPTNQNNSTALNNSLDDIEDDFDISKLIGNIDRNALLSLQSQL